MWMASEREGALAGTLSVPRISQAYDLLMPAAFANSVTPGFSMPITFAHNEPSRKYEIRTFPADISRPKSHNTNMARRGVPKAGVRWYLNEWMAARGLEGRGAQSRMMEMTGWSKATMSQLFNGTQDYSPKILEDAAKALGVEEFELLITPERANALRQLQATAQTIVTLAHESEEPAKVESLGMVAARKRAAEKKPDRQSASNG